MAFVIQMPKLGHATTEGTVVQWHKREGDRVAQGEPILTVETDKAQVEVESPVDGLLGRMVAAKGQVVPVGGVLGVITAEGEAVPPDLAASIGGEAAAAPSKSEPQSAPMPPSSARKRVAASPRAKRLAAERGIDLGAIAGTGPDGLVTEQDVKRALEGAARPAAAREAAEAPAAPAEGLAAASPMGPSRREKLTRIQAAGARNLTESWRNLPHFVQMVRVDMSRALAARKSLAAAGTRLSVTDIILAAAVRALRDNPRVNASYSDGEMIIYERVNLGVAVDTPDGLVVPVVHGADLLAPPALSAQVAALAEKARTRRLRPEDLEGATFTVSNLGAYGVDNGTPVIFAPQAALMFVGAIRDEVLAVDGRPEVRPAMHIAVAYDHRGIDGATASRFTTGVRQLLESADFLGAAQASTASNAPPMRRREVTVESVGESLVAEVRHGNRLWQLSGEDSASLDPVTSFLGALGGCLLMSLRVGARVRKLNVGRSRLVARANEKGHISDIEVTLEVETDIDDEKLRHLLEVAERGCHIRRMISDDIRVTLRALRLGPGA